MISYHGSIRKGCTACCLLNLLGLLLKLFMLFLGTEGECKIGHILYLFYNLSYDSRVGEYLMIR